MYLSVLEQNSFIFIIITVVKHRSFGRSVKYSWIYLQAAVVQSWMSLPHLWPTLVLKPFLSILINIKSLNLCSFAPLSEPLQSVFRAWCWNYTLDLRSSVIIRLYLSDISLTCDLWYNISLRQMTILRFLITRPDCCLWNCWMASYFQLLNANKQSKHRHTFDQNLLSQLFSKSDTLKVIFGSTLSFDLHIKYIGMADIMFMVEGQTTSCLCVILSHTVTLWLIIQILAEGNSYDLLRRCTSLSKSDRGYCIVYRLLRPLSVDVQQ